MAYNTIIQFEYKDINEVDTIVRVKQLDYAGAVTTRDYVSAGAKFAWGDSSNNVPVIYGSQCTVYVDSESDYEFLYLFSSNARKHLVEVTKAGQLFWIGFIEPDSWSEPLVAAPYPVEFTAYDGLGMLDNIDFVDANGDPYTGTMTMIALIQQLLGNIGITLKLNTATDFKEEQQAAGTNYFEVHKVNLEAFEGMTCFEVLEQLLEGHRIQQRNGEWWITSYTLVPAGGSITYRTYTNGSDVSSGTVAQSIEDASSWWSEGEMSMNMLPALRNITLEQDYGYQKNILRNGDFSQLDANGKPKYWTSLYAFECYVKPLSSSGDVFLYVPKQAVSIPTMETLATSINNITAGNGNIKFSIDYAVISEAGNTANVFLQISFVASGGTIYYIQKNEETEEWEWVTSGTNYIQLNSFELTGVSLADVDESFNSFTATLNALPSDGSLVIALMKPNSSYNIDGIGFKDAKIELLLNEDDNYEGSNAITVINNQNNNNVPDNIELVIGVIPQIANNEVIYKGGILRADGTPATGFAAGASAFYSWAELIGRVNASMQRNPRRAYEGTFADIIPRMNLVITDANNSNLRLIETGISYDDGIQAIQGQYVEVLSLSLVAGQEGDYVIKNAVSTGSSGSSGSGGSGSGAATSTANWETLLNRPDWTNYFDYDPVNDEVLLSKTLRITGSLLATASVVARVASAVSGDVLANLTAVSPLYKPTSSSVGLKYNATQFEVNASNELQIQSGVLAPAAHTHPISDITGLQTALDGKLSITAAASTYIQLTQKGAANGVAPLNASGKVAESYLPDSILGQVEYQGTWNPATNTPALPTASTVKGHYYIASADGTYNSVEYKTGDWVISDGTSWTKVDNTDAVPTVFGRTGPILAVEADYQAYYPRLSQAYANPSWISSLAYSKLTGAPDFLLSSTAASTYVPLTRTVAGKALSSNITLSSTDLTDSSNLARLNQANLFTANQTVSASTGAKIQIKSTKDGSWSVGEIKGSLDYYGSDNSGIGPGIHAFVRAVTHDIYGVATDLLFGTSESGGDALTKMRLKNTGRLLLNEPTDAGYTFHVNGTGRFESNISIGGLVNSINGYQINGTPRITSSGDGLFRKINLTDSHDLSSASGNTQDIQSSVLTTAATANQYAASLNSITYNSGHDLTADYTTSAYTRGGITGLKNNIVIEGSTSVVNTVNGVAYQCLFRNGATVTNWIANYAPLGYVDVGSATITNAYGLLIRPGSGGTRTSSYGVAVLGDLLGTNKYAFYNSGAANLIYTKGLIATEHSFELRNSSGTKKWTFELSGDDLVLKNASGTITHKFTQAGGLSAIQTVTSRVAL